MSTIAVYIMDDHVGVHVSCVLYVPGVHVLRAMYAIGVYVMCVLADNIIIIYCH